MSKQTLVRDCMTTQLVTVFADTTLDHALNTMLLNDVSRLPVLARDGRLVGMLSDRDMRLVLDSPFLELTPQQSTESLVVRTVSEVMASPVFAIKESASVVDAVRLMREKGIGGLPVVNDDMKLVGILTRTDILDLFIQEHTAPLEEEDYVLLTQRKDQ